VVLSHSYHYGSATGTGTCCSDRCCPYARMGRTRAMAIELVWHWLPLCPSGPDQGHGDRTGLALVAPVPEWAGRSANRVSAHSRWLPLCPSGPDT